MAVELRKGQKICLSKSVESGGEIVINLNWNQKSESSGFLSGLFGGNKGIDLDLGAFVELNDGSRHVVQALGNAFGNVNQPPYVALDGDDRTGEAEGGENLRVNGKMSTNINRILVYTFIYEGATNWQQADGVVTIKCPGSEDVVVRMDEHNNALGMCAIAQISRDSDGFSVEKIVRFFDGHKQLDSAFGWGFTWQPGSKD